jgi:biopolymer transport protein TolR
MQLTSSSQGTAGGRRRARRPSSTLSEINVVPLVDVMLVLLIVFMISAPMLQRGIEVNLPVASRSQELAGEQLYIDLPTTFREDSQVFIDLEPISLEVLAERVRQLMLNRADRQVYLRGDGAVNLQELMSVLDRLKEGGVEQVAVVSQPETGQ